MSTTLTVGANITIKRSNGITHPAIVCAIDHSVNCVRVEWFENGETKGKEIHFDVVSELNPDITIPNPNTSIQTNRRQTVDCGRTVVDKNKSENVVGNHRSGEKKRYSLNCYAKAHSAKPRLMHEEGSKGMDMVVKGKRIATARAVNSDFESTVLKFKESTLKKMSKMERDRVERRRRNALVKAEKDKMNKANENNPHWALMRMIIDCRSSIEIKPLCGTEKVKDNMITVAIRKRPLNQADLQKKEIDIITVPSKNQLIVHEPKFKVDLTKYLQNHVFTFDYTFNEHSTNEMVYKYTAEPLIDSVFKKGFATCFAYGQTGSGKTHTMSGSPSEKGIYMLAATDIFQQVESTYKHLNLKVSCSFFEIYVKKVSDLLNKKAVLKMLEDGKQQIQIIGLTEKPVRSVSDVLNLVKLGNEERSSGQTSANPNSSRSHAIFQIILRSKSQNNRVHGKFTLVDLAGNERGADTFSSSKVTRLESSEINQSLLSLKECIRAMGRKNSHLPFRGSKLTQVLRDSFVGPNSKTCMIAMISPGVSSCENTLNTLRYADRVKELAGGGGDYESCVYESQEHGGIGGLYSCVSMEDGFGDMVAKSRVDEMTVKSHQELIKLLKKSVQNGEELLKSRTDNLDKYRLEWNVLIENLMSNLCKYKI